MGSLHASRLAFAQPWAIVTYGIKGQLLNETALKRSLRRRVALRRRLNLRFITKQRMRLAERRHFDRELLVSERVSPRVNREIPVCFEC